METKEVLDIAEKHKEIAEIHTFGIGSGASPSLVIELAQVTGGTFNFTLENENIKPKVVNALTKAGRPNLTKCKVRFLFKILYIIYIYI